MDVKQAIESRRSIRKFTNQPVSEEELQALLEAARLAPSSCNCQPWRFKIVTGQADIGWLSGSGSKGQGWVNTAGAVVVCCADTSRFLEDSKATVRLLKDSGMLPPRMLEGLEEYMNRAEKAPLEAIRWAAATNCAIAVTQMMLRAVEMGLGTCWMGMYNEEAVKERFAIPEHLAVVSLLAVGRPAESPQPRPRKPMEAILLR
ncbi:MAG TPA: hypothetical protein ENN39_09400 [Desulfonatronum sp.]|nr:hypothetical protein [Desulfonatronum sp.]